MEPDLCNQCADLNQQKCNCFRPCKDCSAYKERTCAGCSKPPCAQCSANAVLRVVSPRPRALKLYVRIEDLRRELQTASEPGERLQLSQRLDLLINRYHRAAGPVQLIRRVK